MKLIIAALFALALLGTSAANADVVGAHVGPVHVGIGIHHHHHYCRAWGRHHRCHLWQ